jgi:hypothetical protein
VGELPVTDPHPTSPPDRAQNRPDPARPKGEVADDDRPTRDEWGDEPGERDDEWYRRERPPHHE